MLLAIRFAVPVDGDEPGDAAEAVEQVVAQVAEAAGILARQPGWTSGRVARAVDPDADGRTLVLLIVEFESAGSYRRALGAMDVRMSVVPVLYRALDEPTAYEVLADVGPDAIEWAPGDLDPGHRAAGIGQLAPPRLP